MYSSTEVDDRDDDDEGDARERRALPLVSSGGRYFQVPPGALQEAARDSEANASSKKSPTTPARVRSRYSSEGSISLSSASSRSVTPVHMDTEAAAAGNRDWRAGDEGAAAAGDDDDDVICQSIIPPNPWTRRPETSGQSAATNTGISLERLNRVSLTYFRE